MKVYTKKGDKGTTTKYDGQRVDKDDELIVIVSEVDYLLGALDSCVVVLDDKEKIELIESIQEKLWQTAGELSRGSPTAKVTKEISLADIEMIEGQIDKYSKDIKHFVRFRTKESVELNEARLRTRKLEVSLTKLLRENKMREEIYVYINRLSDLLYVLACDEGKDKLSFLK